MKTLLLLLFLTNIAFAQVKDAKINFSEAEKIKNAFGLQNKDLKDKFLLNEVIKRISKKELTVELIHRGRYIPLKMENDTLKRINFETVNQRLSVMGDTTLSLIAKAIYGTDSRMDFYQLDNEKKEIASKVFGVIKKQNLIDLRNGSLKISSIAYEHIHWYVEGLGYRNICPDERFREQRIATTCTAFAIDSNTILTAGHCLPLGQEYSYSFIPGFKMPNEHTTKDVYTTREVFGVKKVEKKGKSIFPHGEMDYAILKTNRKIPDSLILKLELDENIEIGGAIFMIGHPRGLPLKYNEGYVYGNSGNLIKTNLDSYQGNSGAPIFNENDKVIGLIIGGNIDFIFDTNENCIRSAKYSDSEANEVALKINVVVK